MCLGSAVSPQAAGEISQYWVVYTASLFKDAEKRMHNLSEMKKSFMKRRNKKRKFSEKERRKENVEEEMKSTVKKLEFLERCLSNLSEL